MPPHLTQIILTNMNIKLHQRTYFSQGSVTTDLRGGGSFNSIFRRSSFLNLTVKE